MSHIDVDRRPCAHGSLRCPICRAAVFCGCLHRVADHSASGCQEWWRYPDVPTHNARPCGCKSVWTPSQDGSQFHEWDKAEREAGR